MVLVPKNLQSPQKSSGKHRTKKETNKERQGNSQDNIKERAKKRRQQKAQEGRWTREGSGKSREKANRMKKWKENEREKREGGMLYGKH